MWNISGHRIEEIPEVPLVVDDKVEGYKKTKEAVLLLKKLKAWNDIKKVRKMLPFDWMLTCCIALTQFYCSFLASRFTPLSACVPVRVRWGTEGVSSVRDHASSTVKTTESHELSEISLVCKAVMYFTDDSYECIFIHDDLHFWSVFMSPMILVEVLTTQWNKVFCYARWLRNLTAKLLFLSGITLQSVGRLDLLKLAPGGHIGRFCIWTESAFRKLDDLYGTWRKASTLKVDYKWVPLLSEVVMVFWGALNNNDELTSGPCLWTPWFY